METRPFGGPAERTGANIYEDVVVKTHLLANLKIGTPLNARTMVLTALSLSHFLHIEKKKFHFKV